jgi:CubicO group peptidase (beta-lactamase class C family)
MNTERIDQAFARALQQKVFSGAQVLVGRGEDVLYHGVYGLLSSQEGAPPVKPDFLFDVASLTKPLVTALLAMKFTEGGQVRLADPAASYLPAFKRPEAITLEHLLSHRSGLPAWLPLYEKVSWEKMSYEEIQEIFIRELARLPLESRPGAKRLYSDLGFILLGFILEKVGGERLDKIFQEKIATPLALRRSLFNPRYGPVKVPPQEIAATELCPWRNRLLVGEVHDDNAFVLGGVAGHAGLFSTAGDLAKIVRELWKAWGGKSGLVSQKTFLDFVGEKISPKLGWDTVSPPYSQAGKYFSPQSIGHLAFTGCSLWMDPADRKYVILLTNRVHPGRDNEKIKEFRPRIHDLLFEALFLP